MQEKTDALHRPYRWVVLAAYTLVAGLSQLLWLNFAPVLTMIQTRYGVSELLASLLVLVFPALYVLFSIPAGSLIDSRGYRFTVGLGAVGMALFAAIRIFDGSFWALMAGQVGIAVMQPFVVNGISKLVADWFSEEEGAIANGLGTVGMFIGMAVGMALSPAMIEGLGLQLTMVIFAVVSAVIAAIFLLLAKPNPEGNAASVDSGLAHLKTVFTNKKLLMLFCLSFLGLGEFNGLTTWLEQLLAPNGINAEDAGLIGGGLILGGIFGAAIIPGLSDKLRRRKPFLLLSTFVSLVTLYPLCSLRSFTPLMVVGVIHGFFFLPAFALLLEMTAQFAGVEYTGAATSILMLFGNAGGVFAILLVPLVKTANDSHNAIYLLMALLGSGTVLSLFIPETFSVKPSQANA